MGISLLPIYLILNLLTYIEGSELEMLPIRYYCYEFNRVLMQQDVKY